MRKVIKTVTKEIHDFNAVVVSGPMLEKLLTYSKDAGLTAEAISKCVAAVLKLSEEGDVIELDDYADVIALIK